MVKFLFALLFMMCGALIQAQTISVGVGTDTTDYLVGDFIHYKIEVVTRKNIEVLQPSLPDSIPNLELISRGTPVYTDDYKFNTTVFPFILAGYDSVTAIIPELKVEYRSIGDTAYKSITSDSVSVNIHTVPVSTAEEIKDVKSPLLIPYDWLMLIVWILIGLVLIGGAAFIYIMYRKKKQDQETEEKIITVPPHVRAFRELENLKAEKLWQMGRIKDYHSRITEIIRTYFEGRFNLYALELTTTETMQNLKNIDGSEIIHDITFDFLSNADLVKFAKFQPIESVNEEMMKQANEIVQKTIPFEEVPVESEEVNV